MVREQNDRTFGREVWRVPGQFGDEFPVLLAAQRKQRGII